MVDDASSVWLNRTPSDGVPQEVIRFPHTWLVASSYFINITMIAAAVFCLIFTITFRNRKYVRFWKQICMVLEASMYGYRSKYVWL